MKNTIKRLFSFATVLKLLLITSVTAASTGNSNKEGDNNIKVISLTNDTFKQMVFNYEKNKEWQYEGTVPAIIDFYAGWCAPCRELSPIVEEIAKEYEGKIVVYKVDTEKEGKLTQKMGISGLPTLLFVPVKGKPRASMGLISKETLVKAITEVLMIK